MAIETECEGCGVQLRVADEYAGRQARCPQCGNEYAVPQLAQPGPIRPEPKTGPSSSAQWYVQTPEGQMYGPVTRDTLDNWVREGRVNASCQLRDSANGTWKLASVVYPHLAPQPSPTSPNPYSANPYDSPRTIRQSNIEPHRGAFVLVLGILGFLVCPIFSPFAWIMGKGDIRKMDAGVMDPEGRTLTQVGMILGMIYSCILGVILFLVLVWLVFVFGLMIA